MKHDKFIIASDLDGTLLQQSEVHDRDIEILEHLGAAGHIRVIATGRNLFSFRTAIPEDFPIDYLIFSTGSGIMNWKTKELIQFTNFSLTDSRQLCRQLQTEPYNVIAHQEVPENHLFYFQQKVPPANDFLQRIRANERRSLGNLERYDYQHKISQFIVITEFSAEVIDHFTANYENCKIIRTTSPINARSLWLELFPESVSKGNALAWLCKYLSIDKENTISVGNDFNDLDLLNFTAQSYVVANAPEDLHKQYAVLPVSDDGILTAISEINRLL